MTIAGLLRKIAVPPRWWPACAVAIGAAAPFALIGIGAVAAPAFWALLLIIAVGGCAVIALPPRFWPARLSAYRNALTLACVVGVIAAAAGLSALLAVAYFMAARQAYIPNDSNHYDIVPVARPFYADDFVLVTGAGVIVALVAGSLAVIACRRLADGPDAFDGSRSNISVFFTVALCAIAASAAAGLIVTILVQMYLSDAVAAEFYNSPYYTPPEHSSHKNINWGGLIYLVAPVIGIASVLFCAAIAVGIVSFVVNRRISKYNRNNKTRMAITARISIMAGCAVMAGSAVALSAIVAGAAHWYAAVNSPYPYFGSPPDGSDVAAWYAIVSASVVAAAIAPVLLSAAAAKLIDKAIAAAARASAGNAPASPPAT